MNKHMKFEKIGPYVFVTKLAGFEHTKYIQGVATHSRVSIDDVPMVQGKNIRNGSFVNEHEWYIKKEVSDLLPRSILNKPCILIPYVGSNLGEIGIFPCEYICHLASNVAKVELVSEKYLLEYIKYYLQSNIGQRYLFQNKQGSAQPNITMDSIRNTFIIERTIQEQHQICSVFSAIDKKIENNKKICSALEAMAKTIYDYWFMQFNFPDENGKPYRTSGGAMKWNEQLKREIPKEWEVSTLGNLIDKIPNTVRIPSSEYLSDGIIPVIDQSSDFIAGYTDNPDSVLESKSGYIVFGDHTRIVKYIRFPFARGADGTQVLKSNNPCVSEELFYQMIKSIDLSNYGYARHFKFLKDSMIVIPKKNISDNFAEITKPIYEKQAKLVFENIELSKLRDWLLPMLMNGQVRVE